MSPLAPGPAGPTDPADAPSASGPATVEALIRHRLATALGGWRGSLETALPVVAFVVLWAWRQDLRAAVIASAIAVVVLAALRLIHRGSLQHVATAAIATAVAAWFAMRSGRAQDAFLPGILTNAAYAVVVTVGNLARWPAVGFLVGVADPHFKEDPLRWRRGPGIVRVCQQLTWVLVATFCIRVAVMVPLWLQGDVALLGLAKILLGWPLWVAALALMAWLIMRGHTPLEAGDAEEAALAHEAEEGSGPPTGPASTSSTPTPLPAERPAGTGEDTPGRRA